MCSRHQRAADFKHTRGAGAVTDGFENDLRIQTGLHSQYHCFGRRNIVNGDQQIGHKLHLAAHAEFPHVIVGA